MRLNEVYLIKLDNYLFINSTQLKKIHENILYYIFSDTSDWDFNSILGDGGGFPYGIKSYCQFTH